MARRDLSIPGRVLASFGGESGDRVRDDEQLFFEIVAHLGLFASHLELGISENRLRELVKLHGPMVNDVKKALGK